MDAHGDFDTDRAFFLATAAEVSRRAAQLSRGGRNRGSDVDRAGTDAAVCLGDGLQRRRDPEVGAFESGVGAGCVFVGTVSASGKHECGCKQTPRSLAALGMTGADA